LLAETDALIPTAMTARDLCTRLGGADSDSTIERTLREMQAGGLVDGFYEPYIAPRYQITKKGRESLA
jgi:DNA-binding PadR family transcriptional regulator